MIIQLTSDENSLMCVNGKIRIKKEDLSAYFREETIYDGAKIAERTKVCLSNGMAFGVQETPEEIDKLLKED